MAATATARWEGTLKEGSGSIATGSGLASTFSRASRSAAGPGTFTVERIAGAPAGCFSQFLALLLSDNDTPPRSIDTTARVSIEVTEGGPTITRIDLSTTVDADLTAEEIDEFAQKAKVNCPVSKALTGVGTINLEVTKA